MPAAQDMTNDDVIRQIGKTITEIDVLRTKFDRENHNRKRLDGIRDDLDAAQRKLVRAGLAQNTEEFQRRAKALKDTNKAVLKEIQDVNRIAETLEGLVALLGAVQKVVDLFV
jgi:predicted  nucleic acid-binding Zn-ribbon protein